jgi:pyruvate/2-oxoglutarate dehydrogenase complex dihydrolipoamide acyltransferase (E2) component
VRYDLNLPHFDRRVGQARLLEWHVAEGADVGYGDPLVDIVADELTTLEVHRSAKYLTKLAGRKVETGTKTTRVSLVWRLVSSDRGVVRSVVAVPGDVIEEGDTLAVLTATADEDPATAPTGKFRVITEPVAQS